MANLILQPVDPDHEICRGRLRERGCLSRRDTAGADDGGKGDTVQHR